MLVCVPVSDTSSNAYVSVDAAVVPSGHATPFSFGTWKVHRSLASRARPTKFAIFSERLITRAVVLLTFNAQRSAATTGSVKSGMARWRDGASHRAAIFHVVVGTPASVKLYMPSGGGPSALAGVDVPTATSVMTAAAVRPREVITFMLRSGLGLPPACGGVHRVSQCGTGRTKDSAVRR